MEKNAVKQGGARVGSQASKGRQGGTARGSGSGEGREAPVRSKKMTEYGIQLAEKQKVKELYGMREQQFKRFFANATRSKEAAGDRLLSLLERRLDNVVYRLKLAASRAQSRQVVVHGHILVNGKRVSSPSYLVCVHDEISLASQVKSRQSFLDFVVLKRMKKAIRPPEWLELNADALSGKVIREPVRADVKTPIEEQHIIELYSK